MSNVLITADVHIHPHRNDTRRVEDGLSCLRWIYSTARENKCKHLIVAGDLFHDRFRLPTYAYSKGCKIIAENKDIHSIFVLGNHDMYLENDWDVHSLTPLQEWATVIDKPTTLKIAGFPVDFLPYTPTPTKYLKDWNSGASILIAHLAVAEAILNKKYDTLSVEDDSKEKEVISPSLFEPWVKTWLGHYHYGQKLDYGVEYIGSPMQLTYGEAGQRKHVAVFNLESKQAYYVINDKSPQFHIVDDPKQIEDLDVNNAYVKFRCEDGTIESKFEFRKKLSKLGAREIEFEKQPIDVTEMTSVALTNIAALFSDKPKLIAEYVKQQEIPDGMDAEILRRIGTEIVCA